MMEKNFKLELQLKSQQAAREQDRTLAMLDALTKFHETIDHQLKNYFSAAYSVLEECGEYDLPAEVLEGMKSAKELLDAGAEVCYNHQVSSPTMHIFLACHDLTV